MLTCLIDVYVAHRVLHYPEPGPCAPGGLALSPSLPLPQGGWSVNVLRPSHDPCVTCPLHTEWDNPICTEGVVSVSRGERAVMACNISNPFLSVAIYLSSHGKSFKPVFSMRPPGCFCQGGWRLQVQGGMAQLVIDDVSHSQAGCYRWHLQGLQRNIGVTTLNVSGEGRRLIPHPTPGAFLFGRGSGGRGAVLFPPQKCRGAEMLRAPGWGPQRAGLRSNKAEWNKTGLCSSKDLYHQGAQAGGLPCPARRLGPCTSLPFHPKPPPTHCLWGGIPPAIPVLPEAPTELGLPLKVLPSCPHSEAP